MENNIDPIKFEALKMVYQQTAEHHRYYLSWRQQLTAGYLVVLASILYSVIYTWKPENGLSDLSCLVFGGGALLSIVFRELDRRNRDLYHVCQNVGKRIEQELNLDLDEKVKQNTGLFFTLDNSFKNSSKYTHSRILDIAYNLIAALMVFGTAYCIFHFNFRVL